jgi:hypothetical protein
MLMTDDLDLGRWFRHWPLLYTIVFEAFLFSVIFLCFHVVEKVLIGMIDRETLAASIPAIGRGGIPGVACVAAILSVSLLPFFAFKNLRRRLGTTRLIAILLGTSCQPAILE